MVPALEQLRGVPVSIDTSKAEVARRAVELGAVMVNDVTALRAEPALASTIAESGICLCLMHMLGEPHTMQDDPRYDGRRLGGDRLSRGAASVRRLGGDFRGTDLPRPRESASARRSSTISSSFAGSERSRRSAGLCWSGCHASGSWLGFSATRAPSSGPLAASVSMAVMAYERGASIFRVHDVAEHVQALTAAQALERAA